MEQESIENITDQVFKEGSCRTLKSEQKHIENQLDIYLNVLQSWTNVNRSQL